MTLKLELTTASSNLYAWLDSYQAAFLYDGHGAWNGSLGTAGQWHAGNWAYTDDEEDDTNESSVILNGTNFDYDEGGFFSGNPLSLELGRNMYLDSDADLFKQDTELTITPDGGGNLPITTAFTYAIYGLSHGGQVDGYVLNPSVTFLGLTDYFAEQGTNQVGTSGNDTLLSFAGDDVLTGGAGVDIFQWHADYYDTTSVVSNDDGDVLGWGEDVITDFVDGTERILIRGFGWSDSTDFIADGGSLSGNVITYEDTSGSTPIISTITVNFATTGTLGWEDVIFIA